MTLLRSFRKLQCLRLLIEIILNVGKKGSCPSWNLPKLSEFFEPKLDDDPRNKEKWERTNKLCVHAIKCGFSNKFFDNYCHFTCAKDLWDELNGHYGFEDEGAKKFVIAKFMYFQMVEQKSISRQIEDFKKLVSNLAKEGDFYPRGMWLIALYLSCWTLGKSINTSIATIEPI